MGKTTIAETTTVADIASALPSSVRVFQRYGIDFCCGGKTPIGAVCRERGLTFTEIASAIEASRSTANTDTRDWPREPLRALIGHILTTYHQPLREELPRLQTMAAKVARVHGAKAPQLARLEEMLVELSTDLLAHMRKEELVLFPAIDAVEVGHVHAAIPIAVPIAVMEAEHDHSGRLLEELRSLTDGYEVPEWGCATMRALYHGLEELEAAMHVHVHLENNVLFPRALNLTEARVHGEVSEP
jgi:regulator of cell morphogenesis and NO signaling